MEQVTLPQVVVTVAATDGGTLSKEALQSIAGNIKFSIKGTEPSGGDSSEITAVNVTKDSNLTGGTTAGSSKTIDSTDICTTKVYLWSTTPPAGTNPKIDADTGTLTYDLGTLKFTGIEQDSAGSSTDITISMQTALMPGMAAIADGTNSATIKYTAGYSGSGSATSSAGDTTENVSITGVDTGNGTITFGSTTPLSFDTDPASASLTIDGNVEAGTGVVPAYGTTIGSGIGTINYPANLNVADFGDDLTLTVNAPEDLTVKYAIGQSPTRKTGFSLSRFHFRDLYNSTFAYPVPLSLRRRRMQVMQHLISTPQYSKTTIYRSRFLL